MIPPELIRFLHTAAAALSNQPHLPRIPIVQVAPGRQQLRYLRKAPITLTRQPHHLHPIQRTSSPHPLELLQSFTTLSQPPPHPASPMPAPRPHLALIGAGITGTTLSLALTRRNIFHTLYEQSPLPSEFGAGLGFGPNAVHAMEVIDPALAEVFLEGSTGADVRGSLGGEGGAGGGKEAVWIEFVDGTAEDGAGETAFTVFGLGGEAHRAVHRAKWLDVLMGRVGEGVIKFGKRLESFGVGEGSGGRVVLRFADGTVEEADAVIGCDGVKSRVRELMIQAAGWDMAAAKCSYSGKYVYRCMIPMAKAVDAVGGNRAGVSSLWVSSCLLVRDAVMPKTTMSPVTHLLLIHPDGPRPPCPDLPRRRPRPQSAPQLRRLRNRLQRDMAEHRRQKADPPRHPRRRPPRFRARRLRPIDPKPDSTNRGQDGQGTITPFLPLCQHPTN